MAAGAGQNGAITLSATELYDPVANTWSSAGTLLTARLLHTATLLPGGKILFAGGVAPNPPGPSAPTNSVELYDPASNTSSVAASLITARDYHTATLLSDGVVLVVGGIDNNGTALSSSELYW